MVLLRWLVDEMTQLGIDGGGACDIGCDGTQAIMGRRVMSVWWLQRRLVLKIEKVAQEAR